MTRRTCVLGVEVPVRAHLVQLGEHLALDAEALVLAEVPVQDVEMNGGHAVQRALDELDRLPSAAGIEHEAAPGETGPIGDVHRGHDGLRAVLSDQLEERLEAVQHPERAWER